MPGVSIHVVDVSRGVVAAGMEVELHAIDAGGRLALIAKGRVGANGLLMRRNY
jgi:5-hydroxyisourate hydrolase